MSVWHRIMQGDGRALLVALLGCAFGLGVAFAVANALPATGSPLEPIAAGAIFLAVIWHVARKSPR